MTALVAAAPLERKPATKTTAKRAQQEQQQQQQSRGHHSQSTYRYSGMPHRKQQRGEEDNQRNDDTNNQSIEDDSIWQLPLGSFEEAPPHQEDLPQQQYHQNQPPHHSSAISSPLVHPHYQPYPQHQHPSQQPHRYYSRSNRHAHPYHAYMMYPQMPRQPQPMYHPYAGPMHQMGWGADNHEDKSQQLGPAISTPVKSRLNSGSNLKNNHSGPVFRSSNLKKSPARLLSPQDTTPGMLSRSLSFPDLNEPSFGDDTPGAATPARLGGFSPVQSIHGSEDDDNDEDNDRHIVDHDSPFLKFLRDLPSGTKSLKPRTSPLSLETDNERRSQKLGMVSIDQPNGEKKESEKKKSLSSTIVPIQASPVAVTVVPVQEEITKPRRLWDKPPPPSRQQSQNSESTQTLSSKNASMRIELIGGSSSRRSLEELNTLMREPQTTGPTFNSKTTTSTNTTAARPHLSASANPSASLPPPAKVPHGSSFEGRPVSYPSTSSRTHHHPSHPGASVTPIMMHHHPQTHPPPFYHFAHPHGHPPPPLAMKTPLKKTHQHGRPSLPGHRPVPAVVSKEENRSQPSQQPHYFASAPGISPPALSGKEDLNPQRPPPCKCKKSRCLKLYCDCFGANAFCKGCRCVDCLNLPGHEDSRTKAMKEIRQKNPHAFKPRVDVAPAAEQHHGQHNMGCKCAKTGCLKKYCECFKGGILCCEKCKCQDCSNKAGSQKLIDARRKMKDDEGAQFAMKAAHDLWTGASATHPHGHALTAQQRPFYMREPQPMRFRPLPTTVKHPGQHFADVQPSNRATVTNRSSNIKSTASAPQQRSPDSTLKTSPALPRQQKLSVKPTSCSTSEEKEGKFQERTTTTSTAAETTASIADKNQTHISQKTKATTSNLSKTPAETPDSIRNQQDLIPKLSTITSGEKPLETAAASTTTKKRNETEVSPMQKATTTGTNSDTTSSEIQTESNNSRKRDTCAEIATTKSKKRRPPEEELICFRPQVHLPRLVALQIFAFFSSHDLHEMALVCKAWKHLARDGRLWQFPKPTAA